MPGPDRDTLGIEDLRDVVRMDVAEVERNDSRSAIRWRPVQNDAGNLPEPLQRVRGELLLVVLDRLEPDRVQVVDRRAEPDGLGDRRGSRLELVRHVAPGGLLGPHLPDYVP